MGLPCSEKTRYPTGAAARRALAVLRGRRQRSETGKPLREYPCPHCAGHHLTSEDYQDNNKAKRYW